MLFSTVRSLRVLQRTEITRRGCGIAPHHVLYITTQYFDLIAYVSPIVNWNELRFVEGTVAGGLLR